MSETESPGLLGSVFPVLALSGAALYGVVVVLRSPFRGMIPGWAAAPAAIALVVSFVTPVLEERYLLVGTPAVAIAAAAGLSRLRPRPVIAGATVGMLVLSSLSLHAWYTGRFEDWRAAASIVRASDAPGDLVVVPHGQPAFQVYFEGKPDAQGSVVDRVPADARRVWRVLRLTSSAERVLQNAPLAGHLLTASVTVSGIVIQRFDPG